MIEIQVSGDDASTTEKQVVAHFVYRALRDAGHNPIGGFTPPHPTRPIIDPKIVITVKDE